MKKRRARPRPACGRARSSPRGTAASAIKRQPFSGPPSRRTMPTRSCWRRPRDRSLPRPTAPSRATSTDQANASIINPPAAGMRRSRCTSARARAGSVRSRTPKPRAAARPDDRCFSWQSLNPPHASDALGFRAGSCQHGLPQQKGNVTMVVRAGREFLAIPGPTTMPDEVLRAMHRPALDIYSDTMADMTDSLLHDLSRSFATKSHSYIYIANGHGAWEAALSNVLSRGDKVLVLESGRFAIGWGNAAAAMGADVEVLKGDWRRAIRPAEVEARLRQDKDHKIKAILAVQVDTASGAINDIEAIGKAIKAAGHPALFMVDAVASLGCMPFEMDAWGIDVAMSGSQKGLMAPPGLGFVAANDRAREVHKTAGLRTPYWDWTERDGAEHYRKYAGTAPVHLLFALRQSIDMLYEEGLPNVFERHRLLADAGP